jgi:hypothetical protein
MFRHEGLRPLPYGGRADECKAIKKEIDQKSIVGSLASIIFHCWRRWLLHCLSDLFNCTSGHQVRAFRTGRSTRADQRQTLCWGHGPQLADAAETL